MHSKAIKISEDTINVPRNEYRILKELYRTIKRQQLLLRLDEAEKNLKAGKCLFYKLF